MSAGARRGCAALAIALVAASPAAPCAAHAALDPPDGAQPLGPPAHAISPSLSAPEADAPARLSLGVADRSVRLDGDLSEGTADRLARVLAAHPRVERLYLSSDGGLVEEGRGVGALVAAYGLSTVVTGTCASACTLAFVRGRERRVGPRGRLGFHGPYEVGALAVARPVDARQERAAYVHAGLDAGFVARALSVGPGGMWFPSASRLRTAGAVTSVGPEPADAGFAALDRQPGRVRTPTDARRRVAHRDP